MSNKSFPPDSEKNSLSGNICIDELEQNLIIKNLQNNHEILKQLFNSFFDPIFILDKDSGRSIINCNKQAVLTFGFKKEELIGESVRILHVNDDSFASFQQLLHTNSPKKDFFYLDRFAMKRKNGKIFISAHSILPYYDGERVLQGWISVIKDLSSQISMEAKTNESYDKLHQLANRIQNRTEAVREYLTKEYLEKLGQSLTALIFKISDLEKKRLVENNGKNDEEIILKLLEMKKMIKTLIDESRSVSVSLRPSILDDLGLPAAIVWLADNFQKKTGILCKVNRVEESIIVPVNKAIKIFRICQEIFSNIEEHSKATEVEIVLKSRDGFLVLQITDNGIGIGKTAIDDPHSLGILKMKVLTKNLNGKFEISANKKGTRGQIIIPL